MSIRRDFPRGRRDQARSLDRALRDLAAVIKPLADQHGIDLEARLAGASTQRAERQLQLAERLQESVVPLFIGHSAGPPDRIGSCVLVRLDSDFFAFTAAHVIRGASSALLMAPSEGKGGKLLALPPYRTHLRSSAGNNDLDVGVLVLPASQQGPFQKRTFLAGAEIDEDDRPDDQSVGSFYFVLGYPASRTQVKVCAIERRIHQQSFHCSTYPIYAAEYMQEKMSSADHLLLDFDHKEIVTGGKRADPPKLQGVSGGGIFHICRKTNQGPLVAIATQHRRSSRLIVGTRIKHFLAVARELKTMSQGRNV